MPEDPRIATNVLRRVTSRIRRGVLDDANETEQERVKNAYTVHAPRWTS